MIKKFTVGILTNNRNDMLDETLMSIKLHNSLEGIDILLLDNGSCQITQIENQKIAHKYNLKYIYNDVDNCLSLNEKIEKGHNKLICELLKTKADTFCILEDDWKCVGKIPLDACRKFLYDNLDIGQIRIRDFRYDDSFYGGSSLNFVNLKKIKFNKKEFVNGIEFDIAEMHWVNSCQIIRRDSLEYMSTEIHSEMKKMQYFYEIFPKNAQLKPGIFYHIGPQRIRKDLRAKGLFVNENISQN